MSKIIGAIVVDSHRCKGCALCIDACPKGVIALARQVNANGYRYAQSEQADACVGCASCAVVCPDACITVYRMKKEN